MAIKPKEAMLRLAAEIRDELQKLDWLYAEWQGVEIEAGAHSLLMRGKASVFHDFYCGAERIFKKIAHELNGGIPAGEAWHHELLNDMKLDLPGLRPAVVSPATYKLLLEFLQFRHKFRNIYGFDLDYGKLAEIEKKFPLAHRQFKHEVETFLIFIEQLGVQATPDD